MPATDLKKVGTGATKGLKNKIVDYFKNKISQYQYKYQYQSKSDILFVNHGHRVLRAKE